MPESKRPLKVFLCHASTDKPKVRELYRYLKKRGIQPWFDEEDLVGGQDWQVEIPKALATSDAIIICLTKNSIDREGYIQKEIKFALDKALEMPEGRIFLIPVKFEECEVPFTLSRYQWVDLTIESGYAKMMKALKFRASQLERSTVEVSKKDVVEENIAREKAEKEAAEKTRLEAEELARQKTAKEKAEREATERVEKERKAKELREKQAREAREKEKRESEKKEEKSVAVKPKSGSQFAYWFGGFVVLVLGIIFLSSLNNPPSTPQPTPENTQTQALATLAQDATSPNVDVSPKSTSTPFVTLTPTPLPAEVTDVKGVLMELVSNNGVDGFYMDKYEVTNALYKVCVDAEVCQLPSDGSRLNLEEYSNHPVIYVSHEMAQSYCEWRGVKLPTYSQWEAASNGFSWENVHDCKYGNFAYGLVPSDKSIYIAEETLYCVGSTVSVGSYELGKSIYNIYDLVGNVAEWNSGGYQVNGGSWLDYNLVKLRYQNVLSGEITSNKIGFRCAADVYP